MNYKSIIETAYNRAKWQTLLHDIFGNRVDFYAPAHRLDLGKSLLKESWFLGAITLSDGQKIGIYEGELADSVELERNRVSVRELFTTEWRSRGFAGAFQFCYKTGASEIRFSYVSETWAFDKDGTFKKESTDTRRFTYFLGEGHRSRTAIQQFEELKRSDLTLADITKAFSVEAVSKRFFDDYKRNYEDIIEFVTGKRMVKSGGKWQEKVTGQGDKVILAEFASFENPEKAIRDYVKKLMGRLVFLQFIQKKGWLGVPKGGNWGDGDREFLQHLFERFSSQSSQTSFVDDILEPLFDDINTRRSGDLANAKLGKDILIPYLNGGLFEPDKADAADFPLPMKHLEALFAFFGSYNFTIDENDPTDAEVGVDPEMLSRIFENLLEDNKDKGAFYTPKSIVEYMCRESLIAYLQTETQSAGRDRAPRDPHRNELIANFVKTHDASPVPPELRAELLQKLRDVKICDPAIGSGAFPMGLLKELFACRAALGDPLAEHPAVLKRQIIENNIYGVDIEKGAVDIARLRFWLALVVDEESPHALPNLDFKIMQGNSLLESFGGVPLDHVLEGGSASMTQGIFKGGKKAGKKRTDYWQSAFAFDGQDAIKEIVRDKNALFNETDHEVKKLLISRINKNVKAFISSKLDPDTPYQSQIPDGPNDQFFLWHTWFSDVFTRPGREGFDIVIANHPYIKELDNSSVFANVNNSEFGRRYHRGKMDYWYFFMHKAIELSSEDAIINFITSRYWINSSGAKNLIRHLSDACSIFHVVDIGDLKVFENVVGHHMITFVSRNHKYDACLYRAISGDVINIEKGVFDREYEIPTAELISAGHEIVLEKRSVSRGVSVLGDHCEVSQGVVEASDKISSRMYARNPEPSHHVGEGIFVLTSEELDGLHLTNKENCEVVRYAGDGCVKRYAIDTTCYLNLIYSDRICREKIAFDDDYLRLRNHLDRMRGYITSSNAPYGLHRPRVKAAFVGEKIIGPSMFRQPSFTYDNQRVFVGMSFNVITATRDVDLFVVLALLNSMYAHHWFYQNAKHRGVGVDVGVEKLRTFPLPCCDENEKSELHAFVDRILAAKKENPDADTSALESEIDQLVYKLYGLTPEEIAVVESAVGGKS